MDMHGLGSSRHRPLEVNFAPNLCLKLNQIRQPEERSREVGPSSNLNLQVLLGELLVSSGTHSQEEIDRKMFL
jgi:hypothetical protein